jgi:hypothetical protein
MIHAVWGVWRPGHPPAGYGFAPHSPWTPLNLALLAVVLAWFVFALTVGLMLHLRARSDERRHQS